MEKIEDSEETGFTIVPEEPTKPLSSPDIILVDRLVKPIYPEDVIILHPELAYSGPLEYDLSSLEQLFHPNQKVAGSRGKDIHSFLTENGKIALCTNAQDGLAMTKLSSQVFNQHFAGMAVFHWASVAQNRKGGIVVMCNYVKNDVVTAWCWLKDSTALTSSNPALIFKK